MVRKLLALIAVCLLMPQVAWGQAPDTTSDVSAEQLSQLPLRGIPDVTKLFPGVVSDPDSEALHIRGSRPEEIAYFVDGVRVGALPNIPTQAIRRLSLISGFVPARFGAMASGIISVATKQGAGRFFGSFEGITSEATDPYGFNSLSFTLGGPLIPEVLQFFAAGEGVMKADHTPYAGHIPALPEEKYEDVQEHPQTIATYNADGTITHTPFPTGFPDSVATITRETVAAQTGLSPGDIDNIIPTPHVLTGADFETRSSKDAPLQSYGLLAKLSLRPSRAMLLQVGGQYRDLRRESFSLRHALYSKNGTDAAQADRWRLFGTWRQHLSESTSYRLKASYDRSHYVRYPQPFGSDLRNAIYYGDVDGVVVDTVNGVPIRRRTPGYEAHATARRYWSCGSGGESCTRTYGDGNLPPVSNIHDLFAAPGAHQAGYAKGESRMFWASGSIVSQVGIHEIGVGLEYQQRIERAFALRDAESLARFFEDGDVEVGGNLSSVSAYEELPYIYLNQHVEYFGYDYLGLSKTETGNFEALARFEDLLLFDIEEQMAAEAAGAFDSAPHRPLSYGGYLQDEIETADLSVNLGLRLDVFDNNTSVLKDPYATQPIVRADRFDSTPANVGSDFAVYFDGTSDIIGYRSPGGEYFDADGNGTSARAITAAGNVRADTSSSISYVFEDYRPHLSILPRVGVSYLLPWDTRLFASYGRFSTMPLQYAYAPPRAYLRSYGLGETIGNPDLDPEITTQYEMGFRTLFMPRLAVQVTGFYKTQENRVVFRAVAHAFPNSYNSYGNLGSARTKGLSLQLELDRTRNISFRANYTYQHVDLGSDFTGEDKAYIWLDPAGLPMQFTHPAPFDQSHTLNLMLNYRLGATEGPLLFGVYPLEYFGVDVVGRIRSGHPYTRHEAPYPISAPLRFTPTGGLNAARMPWMYAIDLRVDRKFVLGKTSLTAFLWVQNVLNTKNPVNVYPVTGSVVNDGYLGSSLGEQHLASLASTQGEQVAGSFAYHYDARMRTPLHYALPRRTRLGLRVNF